MKKYVYLVYDYSEGERLICACGTMGVAKRELLNYLDTLRADEWDGHFSLEALKDAIQRDGYGYNNCIFDSDVGIVIEEVVF